MKVTQPVTIETDVEVTISAADIEEAIYAELSDPDAAITRTMNTIARVVRGVIPDHKWADLTDKQRVVIRAWANDILERLDTQDSGEGGSWVIHNGYVGNTALFWRHEGAGYTADLADAGRFTEKRAKGLSRNRPDEDFPMPLSVAEAASIQCVDVGDIKAAIKDRAPSAPGTDTQDSGESDG